jgi:hypothetical protein
LSGAWRLGGGGVRFPASGSQRDGVRRTSSPWSSPPPLRLHTSPCSWRCGPPARRRTWERRRRGTLSSSGTRAPAAAAPWAWPLLDPLRRTSGSSGGDGRGPEARVGDLGWMGCRPFFPQADNKAEPHFFSPRTETRQPNFGREYTGAAR